MATGEDKPRLLYVDDDGQQVEILQHLFARDFRVEATTSPYRALEALERDPFDIVLSDLMMPEMTGVEFLAGARRVQPFAGRVVTSAYTDAADILPAIDAGDVHHFVPKPVKSGELRSWLALFATQGEVVRCVVVTPDAQHAGRLFAELAPFGGIGIEHAAHLGADSRANVAILPSPESPRQFEEEIAALKSARDDVAIMVALPAARVSDAAGYLAAGADEILWLPLRAQEVALRYQTWSAQARGGARGRARPARGHLAGPVLGAGRALAGHAPGLPPAAPGRPGRHHRPAHRPDRHRQGVDGARAARAQPPARRPLHGDQPAGGARHPDRRGAVRSRAGRLHRRAGGAQGAARGGRGRHPVPRRDRRSVGRHPGEDPAGARGEDLRAPGISSTPRKADFRLVCATNRPLEELVAAGTFREDLYYRINVVRIELPPLRERGEDVRLLADHFLDTFRRSYGDRDVSLSEKASQLLTRHHWPGNVRELKHVIERAVAMTPDGGIIGEDFLTVRPRRESFRKVYD